MFDDSVKLGPDVVLLHGCVQNCMLNAVEGLLEVYEDMAERRMTNSVDPVIGHELPKKGTMQ